MLNTSRNTIDNALSLGIAMGYAWGNADLGSANERLMLRLTWAKVSIATMQIAIVMNNCQLGKNGRNNPVSHTYIYISIAIVF
jgi:hypothetical protein